MLMIILMLKYIEYWIIYLFNIYRKLNYCKISRLVKIKVMIILYICDFIN